MRVTAYCVTAAMVSVRAGTGSSSAASGDSLGPGVDLPFSARARPAPLEAAEPSGVPNAAPPAWGRRTTHGGSGGLAPYGSSSSRLCGGSIEAPRSSSALSSSSSSQGSAAASNLDNSSPPTTMMRQRQSSGRPPEEEHLADDDEQQQQLEPHEQPGESPTSTLAVRNATSLEAMYAGPSFLGGPSGAIIEETTAHNEDGVFRAYFAGAKRLWADVAEWQRLKKKRARREELTWREARVARTAPRHLLRMFPILVNPLPPPFGFVLIAVAAAAPRVLLTPEFWTRRQLERFATADSSATQRRYAKLMAECAEQVAVVSRRLVWAATTTTTAPNTADGVSSPAVQSDVQHGGTRGGPIARGRVTPLATIVEPFEDSAPLGLDALSRRHLVRLARVARPRPLNRWLLCVTRTRRIRVALRRAARATDEDDDRLAREFLGGASHGEPFASRELIEICAQRGLDVRGADADKARRIKAWLDARAALVDAYGGPLPASFVLHLPALFSSLIDHANL